MKFSQQTACLPDATSLCIHLFAALQASSSILHSVLLSTIKLSPAMLLSSPMMPCADLLYPHSETPEHHTKVPSFPPFLVSPIILPQPIITYLSIFHLPAVPQRFEPSFCLFQSLFDQARCPSSRWDLRSRHPALYCERASLPAASHAVTLTRCLTVRLDDLRSTESLQEYIALTPH